jgi:hypothetical protein
MRIGTGFLLAGAAAVMSGCIVGGAVGSETRGATRAKYTGAVSLVFTNATAERMCGLHLIDDAEEDYGDNWLPEAGLASGGSLTFKVKPGKYKARWDTCKASSSKPYFAATLWRDTAVTVQQETQLYAFVADAVSPTKYAQVMGRDYAVIRFPGQAVDQNPQPQRERPPGQPPMMRTGVEQPQISGFVGRVVLSADLAAQRAGGPEAAPGDDRLKTRDLIDGNARPPERKPGQPVQPGQPGQPKPSLERKHDLSNSGIEYKKR